MRYVDTICKRIPAADSHQACVQHPPVLKKKDGPSENIRPPGLSGMFQSPISIKCACVPAYFPPW